MQIQCCPHTSSPSPGSRKHYHASDHFSHELPLVMDLAQGRPLLATWAISLETEKNRKLFSYRIFIVNTFGSKFTSFLLLIYAIAVDGKITFSPNVNL